MAVRTGEIFNSLIFGGVNSADYGIYITGEATFDAPKRLVDMVSVPGRNGAIALDQGHWDNITVEYPAGVFGSDQTDFRSAMSDFRNAIVSQIGYQRLTDTYHPDEYRMALYVEGIEVDPTAHNIAGEFTLKFNCKPQRWLTSGETAVSVSSGDTLTNPTQYASGPLLAVNGSGAIAFNGFTINLIGQDLGRISLPDQINEGPPRSLLTTGDIIIDASLFENGDIVTVGAATLSLTTNKRFTSSTLRITSTSGAIPLDAHINYSAGNELVVSAENLSIALASSASSISGSINISIINKNTSETSTATVTVTLGQRGVSGGGTQRRIYMNATVTINGLSYIRFQYSMTDVSGESTASALGNPTYIDCEIGEAYMYRNDELIALNGFINFGSDLPTLAPGGNRITFDSTITSLEITPRWWKL